MQLGKNYWNQRYLDEETGWDMGQASPPLVEIFNSLKDKAAEILIPGCGNAYEAAYLLDRGFTHITLIDIAPDLVSKLKEQFKGNKNIQIICGDFFEHQGQYNFIIEQTFFCALNPSLREKYVQKMNTLLKPNGILTGVMFNKHFEKEGPPFGGTTEEYNKLFKGLFNIKIEKCLNSIPSRLGNEVTLIAYKKN